MKNCHSILSIHEGMGTTQQERFNPALEVHFFLIEERKEEDFILFVQRLSKYVTFYNEFDTPEGDWSVFFEKESTAILILLSSWNIELLQNTFEIKKNEIYTTTDSVTQKNILTSYFSQIETAFNTFLNRAKELDDTIIEKENLLASSYLITSKVEVVFSQIQASTDIPALLKSYVFIKTTQQLFGLLLSWKSFSEQVIASQLENYDKHSPHYALFLTFLKLLGVVKEQFNEFTKKQLDFYYREVLRIETKPALPDYAHLVIEPFKTAPFLIEKDTLFMGGENSLGQKKFYKTTADQVINSIKLHSFLSYHLLGNQYYKASNLIEANTRNKNFDVFGTDKEVFLEGFMIASPLLFLQSGEREIALRINDTDLKADDFSFYITGEKGVLEIQQKSDHIEKSISKKRYIKLLIPSTEKSIIPFDSKIHEGFLLETSFPVLKIIPKKRGIISVINQLELNIKVHNFKSYVLASDFGVIDVEKAFYPFGEFPKNGNGMNLSSNEFFMKKNAVASLVFDTILSNRAEAITAAKEKVSGKAAKDWIVNKVAVFQLNNGQWEKADFSGLAPIRNDFPLEDYHFEAIVTEQIKSNGKIRIQLKDKAFDEETYMQTYIKETKEDNPSLPYKPRIGEFVFNYTVSESIDFSKKTKTQNPVEVIEVLPFGFSKKQNGGIRFPKIKEKEGFIYLGFDQATPDDGLTFLIQLEEGTANPLLEPAKISWEYLTNNRWEKLDANTIGDETYALTQSGLVSLTIPIFNASTNTILPSDLFWLRISVSNYQAICNFLGVHVQAFKVVLTDYENSNAVFLEHTPKETITKAHISINGAKKISQPYASFGGREAEKDTMLYTRTSERLRHKNRAITTWDYERIILEAFPEVYRVKTLNHYRYDTKITNVAAGFVTLIPIAKTTVSENNNWKPLLSLNKMRQIQQHLYTIASPQVRINVKPPILERVAVHFKVKYHFVPGMDTRLFTGQLMEIINKYLSPWAYEDSNEINFAGEIAFSSIIQLIDNQHFVDYITDFKVTQYELDENNEIIGNGIQNLTKISPQSDFTLFTPTTTHIIQEIK